MRALRRRRSPAWELSVVPTTPPPSTAMAEPSPWAIRWACPVRALRAPQSKNCGAVRVDTDWPRCAWGLGKEPRWHSNELERGLKRAFNGTRALLHYQIKAELSSAQ